MTDPPGPPSPGTAEPRDDALAAAAPTAAEDAEAPPRPKIHAELFPKFIELEETFGRKMSELESAYEERRLSGKDYRKQVQELRNKRNEDRKRLDAMIAPDDFFTHAELLPEFNALEETTEREMSELKAAKKEGTLSAEDYEKQVEDLWNQRNKDRKRLQFMVARDDCFHFAYSEDDPEKEYHCLEARRWEKIYVDARVVEIPDWCFVGALVKTVRCAPNSRLESIGDSAFFGVEMTSVHIPSSVKTIGEQAFARDMYAFSKANVEGLSVKFDPRGESDPSLSIGESAFYSSPITAIEIPSFVKELGTSAFTLCKLLKQVTFESGNSQLEIIGSFAFSTCGITSIEIPSGTNRIEHGAFNGCGNLTRVGFDPENSELQKIDTKAFKRCSKLAPPQFPDAVEEIAPDAFEGCRFKAPFIYTEESARKFTEIPEEMNRVREKFKEGSKELDLLKDNGTLSEEEYTTKDKELKDALQPEFEKLQKDLESVTPPETVTHIRVQRGVKHLPKKAFYELRNLQRVDLPSTLESIGDEAFYGTRLQYLKVPDSVKKIGVKAFCWSVLRMLTFGSDSKLTTIGENAISDEVIVHVPSCNRQLSKAMHRLAYLGRPSDVSGDSLVEAMKTELKKDSESLREDKNILGMTVLHLYLRCGHSDLEVIRWMVDKYPQALSMGDVDGRYPIHWFCQLPSPCQSEEDEKEIVRLLVKGVPLMVPDRTGVIPLTYALGNLSYCAVEYLYSVEPFFPIGEYQEVITNLRKEYLEKKINYRDDGNLEPILPDAMTQNGWVKFVSYHIVSNSSEEEQLVGFIKNEEKCSHEMVEALAHARTHDNVSALDVATLNIRTALQERLLFLGRYEIDASYIIHKSSTCIVLEANDAKMSEHHEKLFDDHFKDGKVDKASFRSFLEKYGFVRGNITGNQDEDEVEKYFKGIDKDNNEDISKAEFVAFCEKYLGNTVVLKFMKNESQFRNETDGRKRLDSRYVVDILQTHQPPGDPNEKDYVNKISNILSKFFDRSIEKFRKPGANRTTSAAAIETAAKYKYIVVMVKGGKNLDSIFKSEQPDINTARVLMSEVGEATKSLHDEDLVHGDIKMLNIIRETHSNLLKLIDLDASIEDSQPITSKFSSGVIAPELIYFFNGQEFDDTGEIRKLKETLKELGNRESKKVALWDSNEENAFIIKNSFHDKDVREILKVDQEKASKALDVWAFGVLLYCMCTGETIFEVNRVDDISSFSTMAQLYNWDPFVKSEKLSRVPDDDARELLDCIFRKDASMRPSMKEIMGHVFFQPQKKKDYSVIHKSLSRIENKIDGVLETLKKLEKNLEKANSKITKVLENVSKDTPRLIYVVPINPKANQNWLEKIKNKTSFTEEMMVCFVCPITYKIPRHENGELKGYIKELPKGWVRKWGPRIVMTLKVTQFAIAAGRMAGLPIPGVADIQEKISEKMSDKLKSVTEFLNTMMADDSLKELVGGNDFLSKGVDLASGEESLDTMISEKLEDALSKSISARKKEIIETSTAEIKEIANGDEEFKESGLVLATHDESGTQEFVHPSIASFYRKHGEECFKKSALEVMDAFGNNSTEKELNDKDKRPTQRKNREEAKIEGDAKKMKSNKNKLIKNAREEPVDMCRVIVRPEDNRMQDAIDSLRKQLEDQKGKLGSIGRKKTLAQLRKLIRESGRKKNDELKIQLENKKKETAEKWRKFSQTVIAKSI